MKIIFCISDYRIFTERCIPLAQSLQSVGHELYCVTPTGIDAEIVPTTQCDWPNFDMDVIEKIHPDLIIVWNGYFNHTLAAVRWLKRRYKVITMEMGWFHRASHSYLATDLAQVSAIAEVPYVPGVAAKEHYQLELEEVRKKFGIEPLEGLELPKAFIFIPMQLEHDTQIVYTSNDFKTMNSVIGFVKKKVPQAPILVRNHPLQLLPVRPGSVIDMTGCSTSMPLALAATLVVGINSTLLSEAALFRKPVIALGTHVSKGAFLQVANLCSSYLSLRDGVQIKDHADRCDYYSLVLNHNQWSTEEVPGWIIDKIGSGDFGPRIPT